MTPPDHRGDGDGWVECAAGHRHWGRYGAAGLLAHRRTAVGTREVLLQHRAEWSHFGGTWGLLGGARASHETAVQGALREAAEEGAVDAGEVRVDGRYDDDHGGWSYVTVVVTASETLTARPSGGESIDVVWHDVDHVADLPLHPGFAASWPLLRQALELRSPSWSTRPTSWGRVPTDGGATGPAPRDVSSPTRPPLLGVDSPTTSCRTSSNGRRCGTGGRASWSSSRGPPAVPARIVARRSTVSVTTVAGVAGAAVGPGGDDEIVATRWMKSRAGGLVDRLVRPVARDHRRP